MDRENKIQDVVSLVKMKAMNNIVSGKPGGEIAQFQEAVKDFIPDGIEINSPYTVDQMRKALGDAAYDSWKGKTNELRVLEDACDVVISVISAPDSIE